MYGWSTAAEFTVGVENASQAPSGFTASSGTSLSQIYLSWNSVTGATSYQVSYSTSQTGDYIALTTTSATSYTHGGHGPSTVYWYKVRAYIAGTWGPDSSAVRGYTKTGTPTLVSASLGSAPLGTVQVSWNAVPATDGNVYYYVYRRNDPSTTSTVSLGSTQTTGGSFTVPQGTIYYFSVRVYNTITGWGEHSNLKPGYTSNIAVVYNDADTTDTSLASEIRTVLTSDLPNTAPFSDYISGEMPNWSVTLIPQSMIPTTYNDNSVFYGKPLIVTPGITIHTSPSRTRNVVDHGRGVVAMGEGGARLIDRTTMYWSSWEMTGAAPADIGWGKSMIMVAPLPFTHTWTSGNSTWSSPLSSTVFPGGTAPTHEARTQISYRSHTRISVYRANRDNPPSGWLYSRDDASSMHFAVVRQDRFLQFGFDSLTDRPYTGHVFFINLVRRMSQYPSK